MISSPRLSFPRSKRHIPLFLSRAFSPCRRPVAASTRHHLVLVSPCRHWELPTPRLLHGCRCYPTPLSLAIPSLSSRAHQPPDIAGGRSPADRSGWRREAAMRMAKGGGPSDSRANDRWRHCHATPATRPPVSHGLISFSACRIEDVGRQNRTEDACRLPDPDGEGRWLRGMAEGGSPGMTKRMLRETTEGGIVMLLLHLVSRSLAPLLVGLRTPTARFRRWREVALGMVE